MRSETKLSGRGRSALAAVLGRTAQADMTTVTMMNAQTVTGTGLASVGTMATPTPSGGDSFTFQFIGVGSASAPHRSEHGRRDELDAALHVQARLGRSTAPGVRACLYRHGRSRRTP